MINSDKLKYLKRVEGLDFYEYKSSLFNYFFVPMAYYEKLFSRTIRETLDYIRGGYRVIYFASEDKLAGYGIVTKGGGRNKFCTEEDIVLCSLWVEPDDRGKGYSKILVKALSYDLNTEKRNAYEYIAHDNLPSIKAVLANSFIKIGNAENFGILKVIKPDKNGHLGIYVRKAGDD